MTHVDLKRMAVAAGRPADFLRGAARTQVQGTVQVHDIVQALAAEPEEQRCIETGLEVLALAGRAPARAVVWVGRGRRPALDFYVDADAQTCSALDSALQHAIASSFPSVLPPRLALSVLPLAVHMQEATAEGRVFDAETLRACARELLSRGEEMHHRLAVLCAYLSALHEAQGIAEELGYLEQTLLEQGQEALSWRLRRHRSVEGRALAQALEGLSRAADGALYEFSTRYSVERASYQLEQMQRVHDQIARFRDACRLGESGAQPATC